MIRMKKHDCTKHGVCMALVSGDIFALLKRSRDRKHIHTGFFVCKLLVRGVIFTLLTQGSHPRFNSRMKSATTTGAVKEVTAGSLDTDQISSTSLASVPGIHPNET